VTTGPLNNTAAILSTARLARGANFENPRSDPMNVRLSLAVSLLALAVRTGAAESAQPFGADYPTLDSLAVGAWCTPHPTGPTLPAAMDVSRLDCVAFALYTHDHGVLKLTAQLFPLRPDEPREARLEFQRDGQWREAAKAPIVFPGWSAHFRVERWDST